MNPNNKGAAGHRQRLRARFLAGQDRFTEAQLLELLLTYAIPRHDVAPIADRLLREYGSLEQILSVPYDELVSQDGVGENTAALLGVVQELMESATREGSSSATSKESKFMDMQQGELFSVSSETSTEKGTLPKPPPAPPTKSDIRAYTNDLTKVALEHLPVVVEYDDLARFSTYLEENLPYNSSVTRSRYTRYLSNRYFPSGDIETPLKEMLSFTPDGATWKAILFFETVKAEPAAQFMAEQIVWPALPTGTLERSILAEKLQKRFAEASEATVKRMVYSLVNLYTLLDVAVLEGARLIFPNQIGTLPAFVYILAAEFPDPGIYAFELLEKGPMRRWLLWDKEWMRRQLYNLRDLGVIPKISEIDSMRQFTLSTDQLSTIRLYYEHEPQAEHALRESSEILDEGGR